MKGILIVDKPERCSACRFMCSTDEEYAYCGAPELGFDYQVNEYMMSNPIGKPDWCPIKRIPEKYPSNTGDYYSDGWNDCIDKITD